MQWKFSRDKSSSHVRRDFLSHLSNRIFKMTLSNWWSTKIASQIISHGGRLMLRYKSSLIKTISNYLLKLFLFSASSKRFRAPRKLDWLITKMNIPTRELSTQVPLSIQKTNSFLWGVSATEKSSVGILPMSSTKMPTQSSDPRKVSPRKLRTRRKIKSASTWWASTASQD